MFRTTCYSISLCFLLISQVCGHGMLLDPPNRSSMWRYGFPTEPNYTDNQLFCGGLDVQWNMNGGRCGICGDSFSDPVPRANEIGGTYGKGIIVKTYKKGGEMPIYVDLTATHLGHFEFDICNFDSSGRESEDCFESMSLTDGSLTYGIEGEPRNFTMTLRIPQLTCSHCILRWTYHTANNYGDCGNGTSTLGCGPQETFKNCADIAINN